MAKEIGAVSRVRIRKPLLTPKMRTTRAELARKMLNNLKSAPPGRIVFFSDEKNFNVQEAYNRRNSRYVAILEDGDVPYETRYATSTKKPAHLMFLGVVASTGEVSPPIWFKEKETMTSAKYIAHLDKTLIPWMKKVAADHPVAVDSLEGPINVPAPFLFQQDGAPPHTSAATQTFLKEQLGKRGFWRKDRWPPNSPDLNPLDYSIWNEVSAKACRKPHDSLKSLKTAVNYAWKNLDPAYVSASCQKIRSRLQKVIDRNGSIIE